MIIDNLKWRFQLKEEKNTFFNVRQTSEKSPGAILFVEASFVSSATASFLSDHLVAF
jgi:hypothetical protein